MKLKAPKGVGAVSFEGQSYPVIKGMVEVPDEAVVFLEPGYGFTQVAEAEPEAKTQKMESGT
jgi:hypothetical protein